MSVERGDRAPHLLSFESLESFADCWAVGDLFPPSFDHDMIHFNHLPFLEEEPPQEWEVLTARDVMAKHVIVLREIETVGDLVVLLRKTRHNGFPIVETRERRISLRMPIPHNIDLHRFQVNA